MNFRTTLACTALAAAVAVTGCGKSDTEKMSTDTTSTTSMPAAPASGMMDQAKTSAAGAMDSAKSTAAAAGDKMSDMKSSAMSTASNATDAMSTTAQKYYDQAKDYIASKNLTGASDVTSKLDAMKAQLPAEWQAKVTELDDMLAKAKSSASNMMGGAANMMGGAPATQP